MFKRENNIGEITISDVIRRIEKLNAGLAEFWKSAHGWAPITAAELMSKSRLDRQVSLSQTLNLWLNEVQRDLTDGELILARVNLRSLIEGTLKLFLSVFYETYKADIENLKGTQAWHAKQQKLIDPDGLRYEVLLHYFRVATLLDPKKLEFCQMLQEFGNSIHAYKDRQIGTTKEFYGSLVSYLDLLENINGLLPYPDEIYVPRSH